MYALSGLANEMSLVHVADAGDFRSCSKILTHTRMAGTVYLKSVAYSKHRVLTLTATAGFPEVINEYKDYTTKDETAPYYQMEI